MLLLENLNVFLSFFFNSSLSLFEYSLLQDKHLRFIKLSLTISYSKTQSQSLHSVFEFLPLNYQQVLIGKLPQISYYR